MIEILMYSFVLNKIFLYIKKPVSRVFMCLSFSPQNHHTATETDGSVGGGGGLSSHAYLHNTPVDFA